MGQKESKPGTGHRERMRAKYQEHGFDYFSDLDVLEYMLFTPLTRCDTRPIADKLLRRFGSIMEVLYAPKEELMEIEGISEKTAGYLEQLGAFYRRCGQIAAREVTEIRSSSDAVLYLLPHFEGVREERLAVLLCDHARRPVCCKVLAEGGIDRVELSYRRLAGWIAATSCTGLYLAHNHPGGLLLSSPEDIYATIELQKFLKNMDVVIYNHFIIGENGEYMEIPFQR